VQHDKNSVYFDACDYACARLTGNAPRYFPRLHELAKVNSLEELKAIIDSWGPAPRPPTPPPGHWTPGSTWGQSVRVERDRGIIWKLKCACGKNFELSTNDTVPESRRKCPTCVLADELSEAKKEIVAKLEATNTTVLAWHRAHDKLIWGRVHKVLRERGIQNPDLARELHALCWVKITERADQYRDQGFKVSAWLGTVATNTVREYFKGQYAEKRDVRKEVPLVAEDSRDAAAPPTKPEEVLPAKPVRPEGSSFNNDTELSRWDAATGEEWAR
jgi:DNA-directed RNA polymerase specialized sigma24 family protein